MVLLLLISSSLQYLNLRYTSLSDRAIPVLARTLRSQPSLTVLHLENVSLAGRNLILVVIKSNSDLGEEYGNLSDIPVESQNASHASQPYAHVQSGKRFVASNSVSQDRKYVAEYSFVMLELLEASYAVPTACCALKTNTVLRELYLGDNNLQAADGAHIYQLIISNVSIQLLDLRNNQLQDGGLRHICDALKHRDTTKHSALSALVLWNNRITSAGLEALAQALVG
ncbi:unnamed protein product [Gongylonema pulchrum]|uniref:Si:dkey-288a3.2 n=1 Tax=Gongylonema pulchrum TaxID=637853 RepID=A0A183D8H5_9BILA|nr:unnamed protein product [Gongylonema pulchrum]